MNKVKSIEVKDATYLDGFKLRVAFSDGKNKVVDFSKFITSNNKAALTKYKNSSNFKRFKIENDNIVWGKNWELVFPVHQLYSSRII